MESQTQSHAGLAPHHCGRCCTRIEHLGVELDRQSILEDVSLHLHCGELTTVIGPNGAGKSTLLRAILGEVPHSGEIHFLPESGHGSEGRPSIGYTPQRLDFDRSSPISVRDLFAGVLSRWPVALHVSRRIRRTASEALGNVDAGHLLDRRLGTLSGGELQRVLLALSLTPMPNLLLLDEPVSGIDLAGRERFYCTVSDLRRRFDLSVLMISHDLAGVAAVSDRIVFLDRCILWIGQPGEVTGVPEFRRAFGLDATPAPVLHA